MKLVDRIIQQMINDKQGTCESYYTSEEVADALFNMHRISDATHTKHLAGSDRTDSLFDKLESKLEIASSEAIFLCDCCGWWCEVGDMSEDESEDGNVCGDCGNDY